MVPKASLERVGDDGFKKHPTGAELDSDVQWVWTV
jgi:hypothetical protein